MKKNSIDLFTLIYPYRNRDLERVKRSLDSLKTQSDQDFSVSFVDYGSEEPYASDIRELLDHYDFVSHSRYPVELQPWNKCKALNSVIRSLDGGYAFVADVDMIFHPEFVSKAKRLSGPDKAVYFKVGFLDEEESSKNLPFGEYKIKFYSGDEATGLTLFPVEILQKLRGFDEFYHFWGSEDTDIHVRIRNAGHQVDFYDEETLLLHQWHVIYRNKESDELTGDLQLSGIVQVNYEHLKNAKEQSRTVVNTCSWGVIPNEGSMTRLQKAKLATLCNSVQEVDAFLYGTLPALGEGVYAFEFVEDPNREKAKDSLKKIIGKKTRNYYDMKDINDKLLMHVISVYRDYPYSVEVIIEGPSIEFRIAIP